MNNRIEFGVNRTSCGCQLCRVYCRFMPGYLIPADLERLIPADVVAEDWAKAHLLASEGALVANSHTGRSWRVPTLVPATLPESMACHWYESGRCTVHENAPFGCAFFSHHSKSSEFDLSANGLRAIMDDVAADGLYYRLWKFLNTHHFNASSAEYRRKKLAKGLQRIEYLMRKSK